MERNIFTRLFWKMPYGLRRQLRMACRPLKYLRYRQLRTAEPAQLNAPTLKPFIDRKCIFVHIPKSAGLSVNYGLFGRHTGNHLTMAEYQLALTRREFDSFFKFTVVRNPWDRLISAYHFLRNGGRNAEDRRWVDEHLSEISNFEEFVLQWVNRSNVRKGVHFLPQHTFITLPGSTNPLVDFIGYFENIEADYDHVRNRLGGGDALKCENQTRGRRRDYRSYFTEQTREIVQETYREDIELLGYDFNNEFLGQRLVQRNATSPAGSIARQR